MSDGSERLRRALDRLAVSDDVESARTAVMARTRAIRRRRRIGAAAVCVAGATLAAGIIATTRAEPGRITRTNPDVSSSAAPQQIVATMRDRGLVLLDPQTGVVTATLDAGHEPIGAVTASPNGRDVFYVTGDGGYDPTCGRTRIVHHSLDDAAGVVDEVAAGIFPAVDPTGTRLAYLACDGSSGYADTLVIRDLRTAAERRIPVNPRDPSWWATAPSWSPDGRHIATRVVEGTGGGSPLRVVDLTRDASLADAKVVMFSDAANVFGYLGAAGELLGAVDAPGGRIRLVAMAPTTGVPRRTLFSTPAFPVAAAADATGRDVLAIADRTLYVWTAGDADATRLPGVIDFAAWLPNASRPTPTPVLPALRVAFTHTAPDGTVVTARVGDVSIAEARGCLQPAPVLKPAGINCKAGNAPGIQFDYAAPGSPTYRLTVVEADFGMFRDRRPLQPVGIASLMRLVRADGSTIPAPGARRTELAAFHADGPAAVRVDLAGGGTDRMATVDGWAAFAAQSKHGEDPFGLRVQGLDSDGQVVATSLPYRCC